MAYGLLYYNEFTSARFNKLVRIEILKNGYLGSSSQKKIGAILNLENSGDERYEPIKKTTATLSLFSESDREFAEFYTNSSKEFRVDIYRGGSLAWSGFIEADSYSEPYAFDSNYIIEVTARDNLGTLDDIDFLDANGDRYTGLDTAFKIIDKCLAKTGLDLQLIDDIGIWSDTMTETFVTTAQASIVQEVFVDDNGDVLSCYEVLEKVLGGYGAQIRQSGGEWIMREMGNFYDLNKRTEGEYKWLNQSSSLVFKEAWKQFTINQDTKVPDNFYDEFPLQDSDYINKVAFTGDIYKTDVQDWTMNGNKALWTDELDWFVPFNNVPVSYESPVQAIKQTDLSLTVKVLYRLWNPYPSFFGYFPWDTLTVDRNIDIKINDGTNYKILDPNNGWVDDTGQTKLLQFTGVSLNLDSDTEITAITPDIPFDGNLTVVIHDDYFSWPGLYAAVTNIKYSFSSENVIKTITATIDDENNLTPSDFELSIGQVPVEENSILTYFGGLYSSSGVPLVNWHRQGDTNEYDLLEVVGRGYNTLYKQYSYQITGEIFWDWDFLTNIQEDSRVLLVNSGSWDLNSDQANFEFIEVFDYNNAAPIVINSGQVTDGDTNNFFQTSESKDFLAYTIDEGSPKRITDLTSIIDPANYSFILDYAIDADSKRISYDDLKSKITEGLTIGSDIQAWDADLDSISGLTGNAGILRKTAANTWALDTNTYALTSQLHDAVTITGENYASLSGQQITFSDINLATNVTGTLADGNLSSNVALRDAINTAGNLSNVVYSDGTGGDRYVYGLTGRASTRDYFDISGVNKKAGFYWSLDGTNAPTNTSYGNIHVPLATNSTFAFELAGREDRFFLRSLDLGEWKSWREIYHSGNANNSSTPWNASTISTNGTTRIDNLGNYTGGSGNFSDIVTAHNYLAVTTPSDANSKGGYVALGRQTSNQDVFVGMEVEHGVDNDRQSLNFYTKTSGSFIDPHILAMKLGGSNSVQNVELNYDGSKKLETTTTGIDVTGNVVASGLLKETGTFTSGFAGNNWQLDPDDNTQSHLTIDRLTVRNRMDVYELVINQIRATNGSIWVSDATKIETVSGTTLNVNDDTDITFAVNDIIKAQQFDGRNVRSYTARVTSVGATSFTVADVVGTGWDGMELVRIGNSSDTDRQGAIYLTSSDSGSPYIDVIDGVTSSSLSNKTKVRVGKLDGVSGQSGYGIWGSRDGIEESFVISSDGYARIAGWAFTNTLLSSGNIQISSSGYIRHSSDYWRLNSDGSGILANNNISWDASGNVTFGSSVKLNWENYTDSAVDDIEVGGVNLLDNSDIEKTESNEYLKYANLASIFDTHGIGTYTFSFDAKVAVDGSVLIYCTDSGNVKYKFDSQTLNFTTNYQRYSITVNVYLEDINDTNTSLAFYGTYGTGVIPSVKNVKIEKGNKATEWTPSFNDVDTNITTITNNTISTTNVLAQNLQVEFGNIQNFTFDNASGTNVDLTGKITATSGAIGGFTIDANSIYSGTKQSSDTYSTSGITIASAGGIRAKEFYISSADGAAYFKGELQAPTGTIGGFTINSTTISSVTGIGSSQYGIELSSTTTPTLTIARDGTNFNNDASLLFKVGTYLSGSITALPSNTIGNRGIVMTAFELLDIAAADRITLGSIELSFRTNSPAGVEHMNISDSGVSIKTKLELAQAATMEANGFIEVSNAISGGGKNTVAWSTSSSSPTLLTYSTGTTSYSMFNSYFSTTTTAGTYYVSLPLLTSVPDGTRILIGTAGRDIAVIASSSRPLTWDNNSIRTSGTYSITDENEWMEWIKMGQSWKLCRNQNL